MTSLKTMTEHVMQTKPSVSMAPEQSLLHCDNNTIPVTSKEWTLPTILQFEVHIVDGSKAVSPSIYINSCQPTSPFLHNDAEARFNL